MAVENKKKMLVEALTAALAQGDDDEIKDRLAELWPLFDGGDEAAMAPHKLDRAKEIEYDHPILSFVVERHGGMVVGNSTRAEVQGWSVNLEQFTAMCSTVGHKQMHPMQKPLDVGPMANEIAHAVLTGENRPELRWRAPDDVQLEMGKAIPEKLGTAKATMEGRRKRLRIKLGGLLSPHGWIQIRPNRFKKTT